MREEWVLHPEWELSPLLSPGVGVLLLCTEAGPGVLMPSQRKH